MKKVISTLMITMLLASGAHAQTNSHSEDAKEALKSTASTAWSKLKHVGNVIASDKEAAQTAKVVGGAAAITGCVLMPWLCAATLAGGTYVVLNKDSVDLSEKPVDVSKTPKVEQQREAPAEVVVSPVIDRK